MFWEKSTKSESVKIPDFEQHIHPLIIIAVPIKFPTFSNAR